MSIPYYVPPSERSAVSAAWNKAKAQKRMERGADADTLRRRALHDARGQIMREGVTYFGDGRVVPWSVRRSVRGRVDQFDMIVGARVWRTGGVRKVARWIGKTNT